VRYERSDASFRAILYILIGATAFAIVLFWSVAQFLHRYETYQAVIKRSANPLQPVPSDALPREPRLEQLNLLAGSDAESFLEQEAAKRATLQSYGPTPETGYIHVPIDRVMDYLASRLPARQEAARGAHKANGLLDAGEPNSGRMFREKP
jgi:hypothetical protein